MKSAAFVLAAVVTLGPLVAFADYAADKKKYDDCVAKVKKDYPVPPGNINSQNQQIKLDCGNAPTPPKK